SHWFLEQAVSDLSTAHLHWVPPGTANTIAATYAHVIGNEDGFVHTTLLGQRSLAESVWVGRNGISLPIPQRGSDWFAWSRRVQVDLPAAQRYAAAVYAATDEYLGKLKPDELDRAPDVALPANQSLSWLLGNFLILHASVHSGEIAVLRGLQGLVGFV
ncbi:MAG TPA: DinB family protein, partial [Chloroflexota bacterium]|nr:DinB family protein [Chloroflexota bacterium]